MSAESRIVPVLIGTVEYRVTPDGNITYEAHEPIPHFSQLNEVRKAAAGVYLSDKRRELNESEIDYWENVRREKPKYD